MPCGSEDLGDSDSLMKNHVQGKSRFARPGRAGVLLGVEVAPVAAEDLEAPINSLLSAFSTRDLSMVLGILNAWFLTLLVFGATVHSLGTHSEPGQQQSHFWHNFGAIWAQMGP